MIKGWFITGTDTGVGKTEIAALMLRGLNAAGVPAVGMKPVASGCRATRDGLRSEDAERLIAASCQAPPYDVVNPYAFAEPTAPHLVAQREGVSFDIAAIRAHFERLARLGRVVVEGVGGWLVPIDRERTMAEVARALALPAVMVVGVRLGCISHALLTARAIAADGVPFRGWVANEVAPDMLYPHETIATLADRLGAPLAIVPFRPSAAERANLARALAHALAHA